MDRNKFDIAAQIVDRMDKIEKTIYDLQKITNKKSYKIIASDSLSIDSENYYEVNLNSNDISTEIFSETILEYFINDLNLELEELRKNFYEL